MSCPLQNNYPLFVMQDADEDEFRRGQFVAFVIGAVLLAAITVLIALIESL